MLGVVGGQGDMRRVMLVVILALIALVGGRVMPFFTRTCCPVSRPVLAMGRTMTFASLLLLVLAQSVGVLPDVWLGVLWMVFTGTQAIRLGRLVRVRV